MNFIRPDPSIQIDFLQSRIFSNQGLQRICGLTLQMLIKKRRCQSFCDFKASRRIGFTAYVYKPAQPLAADEEGNIGEFHMVAANDGIQVS